MTTQNVAKVKNSVHKSCVLCFAKQFIRSTLFVVSFALHSIHWCHINLSNWIWIGHCLWKMYATNKSCVFFHSQLKFRTFHFQFVWYQNTHNKFDRRFLQIFPLHEMLRDILLCVCACVFVFVSLHSLFILSCSWVAFCWPIVHLLFRSCFRFFFFLSISFVDCRVLPLSFLVQFICQINNRSVYLSETCTWNVIACCVLRNGVNEMRNVADRLKRWLHFCWPFSKCNKEIKANKGVKCALIY